jgi:hypothetical protein
MWFSLLFSLPQATLDETMADGFLSLAAVNFFLGLVGVVQVSRIVTYNMSQKGETVGDQVNEAKVDVKDVAKDLKGTVEDAVKS